MYSHYGVGIDTKIKTKNIIKLLIKANEKEYEDNLWEVWKLQYPHMNEENFISFKDYKKKNTIQQKNRVSEISYEEIEKEMNEVIKAHEAKELNKK